MIQKSYQYAEKQFLLSSMLKTVVLLNIFVENTFKKLHLFEI